MDTSNVSRGARSLLLVDDDEDVRAALTTLLASEGYQVSSCENGREALECLRHGVAADLILLDLVMPVIDGWQFRLEQRRDPRLTSIPVVAISADVTPKASAIDADAYVSKPLDCDAFLSVVARALVDGPRRPLRTDAMGSVTSHSSAPWPPCANRQVVRDAPLCARRARVLLVDDEPMIVRTLERFLGKSYDVISTTRGAESIERVRNGERFDAILCDLMMSDRTGMDVHAAITAISPAQASRMIFLTGGALGARATRFLAECTTNGRTVFEKPFVIADLLTELDTMVSERGLCDEDRSDDRRG